LVFPPPPPLSFLGGGGVFLFFWSSFFPLKLDACLGEEPTRHTPVSHTLDRQEGAILSLICLSLHGNLLSGPTPPPPRWKNTGDKLFEAASLDCRQPPDSKSLTTPQHFPLSPFQDPFGISFLLGFWTSEGTSWSQPPPHFNWPPVTLERFPLCVFLMPFGRSRK